MDTSILTRIQNDVESNQVMLYMKGTPVFPQCGFSAAVVAVLNNVGVEYHSVNVLEDPGVRQGIKEYANWPTIPQLVLELPSRLPMSHQSTHRKHTSSNLAAPWLRSW